MIARNIDNDIDSIEGKLSLDITGITCDSKTVKEGHIFIALKGNRFDGRDFIDEAIDRGVSAVILESSKDKIIAPRKGKTFLYVRSIKNVLPQLCKVFYGDVSKSMDLIGVSGTNGKTTITYLVESLFKSNSKEIGVIGTVNYRFGDRLIPAFNTTPGILDMYYLLSSMKKQDITNAVLEASSHSLAQGRLDGIFFDVAIFTNLTREHLDYHKDMEDYFRSKLKLFKKLKTGGKAVINLDDEYGRRIVDDLSSDTGIKIITYGIDKGKDVYASNLNTSFNGLEFTVHTDKETTKIISKLIGRHNVYNILASFACGIALETSLEEIKKGIEALETLPGRLERIDCGQDFLVFVDYAHTENGLQNVLESLRELNPKRLITIFGCGGDRDKHKRPNMGKVSSELSDKVILTSDNPRSEEPMEIIREIIKGIKNNKNNYIVEIDRANAISIALEEAKKGDIVLVAGKGHETYQVFKNNTLPFDDRETVRRNLCSQ
ncbi:MAG: UDP-N-acetylmuramoyl-L-alanyl-D-glutamate--2,6-diaminopimelate ligase [Candidatus Omnitrophota bacterium]